MNRTGACSNQFKAFALFTAIFSMAVFADEATAPKGILWESTSQMTMQGMPFSPPPQKAKYCAATTWSKPPPGGDSSCVNTDFKVVGNTASWKMECHGQNPMTGTGEITFDGTDAYTGQITATSEGVNVTIKLSGKKIGTCDHPQ